ncbi:MAG: ABC transporter ATP-binding protein [Gammaproteobacteria bacterium]|nr:ABC transporter ATP-binding protein [Gammaproteobacteria bacterium]
MHNPLLKVDNLQRSYGKLRAVQNISFDLNKGEVLGFLGPNGAGKSTTMQMLSGVLAPDAGEILIDGIDIAKQPASAKAKIGYLPETPPLYPDLTVQEYLYYVARLHRISGPDTHEAVQQVLEQCNLVQHTRKLIGTLSKGYQQRVGVAQAIIHKPDIILLDEPTNGLDPIQIREIRTLIQQLGLEHAIVLSSHILPEVEASCSRVLILNNGSIVFSEQMENLQERSLEQIFIELTCGEQTLQATEHKAAG